MATHIFVVSEENYNICIRRGLVGVPEPSTDSKKPDEIMDALISRMSGLKKNDYVLMYITGLKELRGLWLVDCDPFYDDTNIGWSDKKNRVFPLRCKIIPSKYNFKKSLRLDDISDFKSNGKIWTWTLQRASFQQTPNSEFDITSHEAEILINEYIKLNPFEYIENRIPEPYADHTPNIMEKLHFFPNGNPKYEATVMALLNKNFASGNFSNIFGNYDDYISYVPTSLGKEIDFLLIHDNPITHEIASYNIIELKRDAFKKESLQQLIGYESWFVKKKVFGDQNMVRVTAIANSFTNEVIEYVKYRNYYEGKTVDLVKYSMEDGQFKLEKL